MDGLLLRVVLPVELTNGNDGRGSKWFRSAERRQKIAKTLVRLGLMRKPWNHPTRIVFRRILGPGQRLWDADSVGRGSAKEIIDALVEIGWWHDDGPRWITHCDYRQDASMRPMGPAVMVEVFKATE
jgi:hypothetical protein